jgi:adenylate cyclase
VAPTRDQGRLALINGPLVVLVTLFGQWLNSRVFTAHARRTLAWLREERAPTIEEHRQTLSLALYAVRVAALEWIAAGILFALLNGFIESWGFAAVVAATIWLGGETTCALAYLLNERALRQVTALSLAARPAEGCRSLAIRTRLGMAWLLGTGVPLVGLLALGIVGAFGLTHHPRYVGGAVLFLAVVASITGALATRLAAQAIADPLTTLRRGLERIGRGELDVDVPINDGSEIGQLQVGFNHMVEGLRERRRVRELFGRHVGEEVAQAALTAKVRLGGEEREVAALYIDLVGSTSLALALPPADVVAVLNRFFRVVVDVVESCGGLVNKFEGDAALCVFGAPVSCPDPAGDALQAARELAGRLSRDLADLDFGIGVSAGTAVAGNIGAERRFEYTVVGDPVNEAARLAELAKEQPERVLASRVALEKARPEEAAAWEVTGSELLRGRLAPTQLAHPVRDDERTQPAQTPAIF